MVDHRSVDPQQSTQWRKKFAAAMREPNKNKLAILITEAEDAIFARLQQLDGKADPELDAIAAAIPELRKLQVEKLNFPPIDGEVKPPQRKPAVPQPAKEP